MNHSIDTRPQRGVRCIVVDYKMTIVFRGDVVLKGYGIGVDLEHKRFRLGVDAFEGNQINR
jgi:hypothetical protein